MAGGILGTVGRVLIYLILIALVTAGVTMVAISFLQPRWYAEATESVPDTLRNVLGYPRGRAVGRAIAGVDPPSNAERLAASASQHIVTAGQEVVMTGVSSGPSNCLGADDEVMIEIQNDIGADQLDLSYVFDTSSSTESQAPPPRYTKVASCGPQSQIRQCIPLPPVGSHLHLQTLAYYNETTSVPTEASEIPTTDADGMVILPPKRIVSSIRQEERRHPSNFDAATLKTSSKVELMASAFVPAPFNLE